MINEEIIKRAVERARTPGEVECDLCGDNYFSPMEKLSIALYRKCSLHLNDNMSTNLMKIAELL